jgi:DNA repair ATPase RecN
MAEAIGLVTGLASLAISITEGVMKLRDLYKESKTNSQEVESLMRDLEFLTLSVKGLEGLSTLDDQNLAFLIGHCQTVVQDVASSLREMTDTLDASEKKPRKALSRMKWLSSNKKSLEQLKGLTEAARSKISLYALPNTVLLWPS